MIEDNRSLEQQVADALVAAGLAYFKVTGHITMTAEKPQPDYECVVKFNMGQVRDSVQGQVEVEGGVIEITDDEERSTIVK